MNPATADHDEEAVFNIGTAARKSGLSVTTIRTWEDRYGTVTPTRDRSGRRLYSNHQIAQLTWLRQQVDAGLRASEAHRLLESQPMDAADPATSDLGDLEASWATFLGRAQGERSWLDGMLADLRSSLNASAVLLGPVVDNPIFGSVLSAFFGSFSDDQAAASLRPMAGRALESGSELLRSLLDHRVALCAGSDLGLESGQVELAPIHVDRALVGVLAIVDSGRSDSAELAEHAARVIESRIEADLARSAFTELLH